jgi:DNA-binding response OmpR family regulator
MSGYRVLAVGGDRTVLVGLARAFQAAGATFAAAADPSRVLESAVRFSPHLLLVFGRPSPEQAVAAMRAMRGDARFVDLPIVLVASLPPKDMRGFSQVVPDPSDVGEFVTRALKMLAAVARQAPEPPQAADDVEEIDIVEEIEELSARILLVDDDASLTRLFSTMMKKSGFDVTTGADGIEGLKLALEQRPDLIVADLNMPRLDGWGLLRAIRADHRVGETPVMFLSAHDDYRESLKALSAGAQDYLAKGGKLDVLVARIRTLLAPRDAFLGALGAGDKVSGKIGELGVQWSLRKMAANRAGGLVVFKDPFWAVTLGMADGELIYAHAEIGAHKLDGATALPPLVALRSGELLYLPTGQPPGRNIEAALPALLEEAALKNNQSEAEALDTLLTQAKAASVDEQLYLLYEQLGPPASREVARLVRQGMTPREVVSKATMSPLEVEDTLRDLVRRRVLRLQA